MRQGTLAAALLILALSPALDAPGQYFGRNQVLWEQFDFHVLDTPHFSIHHYPRDNRAVVDAARMAERWHDRLASQFRFTFSEQKPIILYADHADFQQTTVGGGLIGEGTGGFTEPLRSRLVMPLTGSYEETDHVLGHEMVHEFQFEVANAISASRTGAALRRLPLWMIEGLAEYLSVGPVDAHTAMWLRDAAFYEELPSIRDLNRKPQRYFPYRFGHAFWAFVAGRFGDDTVMELFVLSIEAGLDQASEQLLGMTEEELGAAWKSAILEGYEGVLEERNRPGAAGEAVLSKANGSGDLNLAPSLSPDGSLVAFLSTRDLFQIELFLADARTGQVIKKLVSASSDAHFDAIRFIDSAGGWSPDGAKLAFVVFAKGDNHLAVLDVASRRVERRIELPGVGALSSPAWSPDGRRIVVSGVKNGVSDLYTVDLASAEVTQLTNDLHADLQPVFSPDGRTIAFTSDRGRQTDFEALTYSPMQLSLYDVATGRVRTLDVFPEGKHVNPQFAPDGGSLFFIGTPDGVPDVFRVALDSDRAAQVTRVTQVLTGVSGITDMSPALSVAAGSGRLMYSLFVRGGYEIHSMEPAEAQAVSEPLAVAALDRSAAVLPPGPGADRELTAYLGAPSAGLPPAEPGYDQEPYAPDLGVELVGPPAVGVTASDEFGVGLGGGVSLYFSDILGRHQLGLNLQGQGGSGDFGSAFGAQVSYLNRTHRLNYGAVGAHIPYLSGRTFVDQTVIEIDGQPVVADVVQQVREEVTIDQLGLIGEYPVSLNRRFEASAYFTRQDFDREVDEVIFVGGQPIARDQRTLPSPEGVSLYQGSVAFVQDTSFFGFTSPVRGSRYRLEVGSVGGDLSFQTARVDLRRYFWARPVTFALRGFHYGRYGGDADSDRLSPLFVGRETLVRGYDVDSFSVAECTQTPDSGCIEFDRLVGSRVGVFNFEIRLPLLGNEQLGLIDFPYFPTDLVAFVDAGVAWNEGDSPEFDFDEESLERVPVVSAGLSLRTIVLGYFPVELYLAYPFQRPQEDAVFGFVIAPGW